MCGMIAVVLLTSILGKEDMHLSCSEIRDIYANRHVHILAMAF